MLHETLKHPCFTQHFILPYFLAIHSWNKILPHELPVLFPNPAMKPLCPPPISKAIVKIIYEKSSIVMQMET